jgi:hypothetical protein
LAGTWLLSPARTDLRPHSVSRANLREAACMCLRCIWHYGITTTSRKVFRQSRPHLLINSLRRIQIYPEPQRSQSAPGMTKERTVEADASRRFTTVRCISVKFGTVAGETVLTCRFPAPRLNVGKFSFTDLLVRATWSGGIRHVGWALRPFVCAYHEECSWSVTEGAAQLGDIDLVAAAPRMPPITLISSSPISRN